MTSTSRSTALLDANVLYSAALRDLLVQLAIADVFRARWTTEIHREWIDALLRRQPWRERTELERTRDLMIHAVENSSITGYESLIPTLHLPDRDDRHVLAAAIAGGCDTIVTMNLGDFPELALLPHGITAEHPDGFLHREFIGASRNFYDVVQVVRGRLRNPPFSEDQYYDRMAERGLGQTAAALRDYRDSR